MRKARNLCQFVLPFIPVWQRPRRCGDLYYHTQKYLEQRMEIRRIALEARPEEWPLTEIYCVSVEVRQKCPKNPVHMVPTRFDIDNVCKEILDALQSHRGGTYPTLWDPILWQNDSSVYQISLNKLYGQGKQDTTSIMVDAIKEVN